MANLALFDFDGTLTTKDSLGEFIRFAVGESEYKKGLFKFIPYFLGWKLKLMRNDKAKEKLFGIFFKGIDEVKFKMLAQKYSFSMIDPIIRDDMFSVLESHMQNQDKILVVSASMNCWLEPYFAKIGIDVLATELEFVDGKFSGKFKTPNCHGIEKVNRIKEAINLDDYEHIYAYGDSDGDKEMLELAHTAYMNGQKIS